MSALLARDQRVEVTTTEQAVTQARELSQKLHLQATETLEVSFSGSAEDHANITAPAELTALLRRVLDALATGRSVTIGTLPKELTTTTAAKLLGISRPTLMQLVQNQKLPAHLVGSHTRLWTKDVQEYRDAQIQSRRDAFDALRELEAELD